MVSQVAVTATAFTQDRAGETDNAALTEMLLQVGAKPYDQKSVYHASDEGHEKCLAVIEQYADPNLLAAECTKCLHTQMHWGRFARREMASGTRSRSELA